MNEELLEKLLEYIDAKIDMKLAHETSDGGLIESILCTKIKEELRVLAAVKGGQHDPT
jgi:hypothetical protein